MRPVRARAAADRVELVEALEDPHARSLVPPQRKQRPARRRAGRPRRRANAACHDVAETSAAKMTGETIPAPPSTVCCRPIAAPLRTRPASSAAVVNESPFHAIERPPASASAGTSSQTGPLASAAVAATTDRDRDADAEERPDARADDVRPAADPDPQPHREHLRRGHRERGAALGEPVLVVQEDDGEPEHGELRVEIEAAPERQPPELAVARASRATTPTSSSSSCFRSRSTSAADERAGHAERREEEECRLATLRTRRSAAARARRRSLRSGSPSAGRRARGRARRRRTSA